MASVASLKAIRMMDYMESFGYKWPAIPQLFQFTSMNPGRGIKELRRKGCSNNIINTEVVAKRVPSPEELAVACHILQPSSQLIWCLRF